MRVVTALLLSLLPAEKRSYVHTWTVDGSSLELSTNYEQGYSMAKKPIE